MNFSKKFLRVVSLVLMVLILIPAMPTYAATFKDVPSSHWAYSYIEKMANLKFITGYDGGVFKPKETLTYLETLKLLSNLLELDAQELSQSKQAYGKLVSDLKVPTWAQDAVIKCLYRGVISEAELRNAVSKGLLETGTNKRVGRLDISIFMAKAMGLEDEANSLPFVSLTYKDLLSINSNYHKMIYILIQAGVLSANGTGNGYFEPSSPLLREQMAKMLSTAYDYLQKTPQTPTTPTQNTEAVSGTITKINKIGDNTFLGVRTNSSTESTYLVDSKTSIKLDNKATTASSLFEGQTVEITMTKGTSTALTVLAKSIEEEITGIIKTVSPISNVISVEYTKDKSKIISQFTVDKNTSIELDGAAAALKDISINDEVKLVIENNLVIELEALSKSGEVEGIIADLTIEEVSRKKVYYITIENSKGKETEYEIDEDVVIYRNGKKANFEALKEGDEVDLELEYGLVVEIDADVVEKDIEGFITAISTKLNSGTEITISNRETGDEETYLLSRDVEIEVDGKVTNSFSLNVGYFVDAVIGSNEIIEIEADSSGAESMILGQITGVSTKRKEIDVEIRNTDVPKYAYGDKITIKLDSNTDVIEGSYYDYDIDDLSRRMSVLVFGFYDGYTFIASEIIIR